MSKQRGNGEGTICRRKDGRWCGAVSFGRDPATGKTKRAWFYGDTREEVARKIAKALHEIQTGVFVEPTKVTLGQWLDTWLNEYAKPHIRPTTWQLYEYLIRVHIKPALGHIPLKTLRPEQIQAMYNAKWEAGRTMRSQPSQEEEVLNLLQKEGKPLGPKDIAAGLGKPKGTVKALLDRMIREGLLRREGRGKYLPGERSQKDAGPSPSLSARTICLMHAVLHGALKQAVKVDLVARNVSEATSPPRSARKEIRVLSHEEQDRLLSILEKHRLGLTILLGLATGLRRGEILALRWQDVDLSEGLVNVTRGLVELYDPTQKKGQRTRLAFQEVKSAAGKRVVPIPEDVLPVLRAHRARQAEEKLFLGREYQDNGLVFATERGEPIRPGVLRGVFTSLLKEAGLTHAGLHTLRHSFATRLLEANEHPKVVQEILGHSQISMTLDTYSHVGLDLKRRAVAKLNGTLRLKEGSTAGKKA